MIIEKEIRHFHLFCGLGGGAKGFNQGQARVGNLKAKFRCVGGIDVDASAIRDDVDIYGNLETAMVDDEPHTPNVPFLPYFTLV